MNDEYEHRPRVLLIEPTVPRLEQPADQQSTGVAFDEQAVHLCRERLTVSGEPNALPYLAGNGEQADFVLGRELLEKRS